MLRFIFIFVCLFFYSCSEPVRKDLFFVTGNAMTIDYKISVGGVSTVKEKEKIYSIVNQVFTEVDQIYNNWNPDSEVSVFNRLDPFEELEISPQLTSLLHQVDEMVSLTEGLFDPTVAPIHSLWKKRLLQGKTPSEQEITALSPAIGWHHIHLEKNILYKDHADTTLDLCGIAKGTCVDLLVEKIQEAGFPDVLVEWGGEIRAAGNHPEGRSWQIFISDLGNPNPKDAIEIIQLKNQAIAASGNYWQNWEVEGKRYTHIVDPVTLKALPVVPGMLSSVNVLANTCAEADALATAAMLCCTKAQGVKFAEKVHVHYPEISFWFLAP